MYSKKLAQNLTTVQYVINTDTILNQDFVVAVADPGFPVRGVDLVVGCGLPRRLPFENFVCQNKGIWTLRGRAPDTPPPKSANALYQFSPSHVYMAGQPNVSCSSIRIQLFNIRILFIVWNNN